MGGQRGDIAGGVNGSGRRFSSVEGSTVAWPLGWMHGNTPAGLPRTDGDHSEILGVVGSSVSCTGVRGGVWGCGFGSCFGQV